MIEFKPLVDGLYYCRACGLRPVCLYSSGDHEGPRLPLRDARWGLLGDMTKTPERERLIPGGKDLACIWPNMSSKKIQRYLNTVADRQHYMKLGV